MKKLFYKLTQDFPRKLPQTTEEFQSLKKLLMENFDIEDRPDVWITVYGHIAATEPFKMRKSLRKIVNPAKRLDIAKKIQELQKVEYDKLQLELQEKAAKLEVIEGGNDKTGPNSDDMLA